MNGTKNVIITGGATGIGAACSRLFAGNGYNVIINWNSSEEAAKSLEAGIRRSGGSAFAVRADVSTPEGAETLVDRCVSLFGAPDVLVNNAGIAPVQKLITDVTPDEYRRVMDVNMGGAFYCSRAALPSMIHEKSGSIVNISSIWGRIGGSCETVYSASKGAVIAFTKALAKEVGPSGIRVNCVCPGVVDTRMNAHLDGESLKELAGAIPLCRIGTPEEIAGAVLFLASPRSSFITGAVLDADGGGLC